MAKLYAVKVGKETGIFETWDECKENTHGIKGAKFKSFSSRKDAENYLVKKEDEVIVKENYGIDLSEEDQIKEIIAFIDEKTAVAYVDGSYNTSTNEFGAGALVITHNGRQDFKRASSNPEYTSSRNVSGEIFAAMSAMKFAKVNKYKTLILHFDYKGIESWATGEWKVNSAIAKLYKSFYDKIKEDLTVDFVKVKAHSGNVLNDVADRLAKDSVNIK